MTKKTALITYVIAIHLALVIVLTHSDFMSRVYVKTGMAEPGQDYIELRHKIFQDRRDPLVPEGAAIFLGDSITQGFVTSLVAPVSVNFGIGQQTTARLIDALPGYRSLERAGAIYLMIGINDIQLGKTAHLPSRFRAIAQYLPNDVPLHWSGIMPADGYAAQITEANEAIRSICASLPACQYADTAAAMSTKDGRPRPGLLGDGTHPTPAGYRVWRGLLNESRRQASPL